MKKGTKHSEETRAAIAERTRQTLTAKKDQGKSLKERLDTVEKELQETRRELQAVKAQLGELQSWKDRVVSAVEKHRPALQRVAEKGGPGGDMCRELLEAFAGLDENL